MLTTETCSGEEVMVVSSVVLFYMMIFYSGNFLKPIKTCMLHRDSSLSCHSLAAAMPWQERTQAGRDPIRS
jgi:hypothetical protein